MAYNDDRKVLFRKVTDDIKNEKGVKFVQLMDELGLKRGAFDGMRRGMSVPSDEVMDKLKELYPNIYVKYESKVLNDAPVKYLNKNHVEIVRLQTSNDMLQEIVNLQRKNMGMMEKEIERLVKIINDKKIKI